MDKVYFNASSLDRKKYLAENAKRKLLSESKYLLCIMTKNSLRLKCIFFVLHQFDMCLAGTLGKTVSKEILIDVVDSELPTALKYQRKRVMMFPPSHISPFFHGGSAYINTVLRRDCVNEICIVSPKHSSIMSQAPKYHRTGINIRRIEVIHLAVLCISFLFSKPSGVPFSGFAQQP